jgi:protein-L-isoaspartate(D-aspartate) O-methyltransferase
MRDDARASLTTDEARVAARRTAMVEGQLRARGIADERVLAAMAAVPREAFLPESRADLAYVDAALPIAGGQTISQPYIVGRMTELLAAEPGDRILEIGTGSGYQAAILAAMGCQVVSIERLPELADAARRRLEALDLPGSVEIRVGDGTLGDPAGAPYPGIIVTAAAPRMPEALREQLDPNGGRLVVPVGSRWQQELTLVVRQGDEWREHPEGGCVFVPLIGEAGFGSA